MNKLIKLANNFFSKITKNDTANVGSTLSLDSIVTSVTLQGGKCIFPVKINGEIYNLLLIPDETAYPCVSEAYYDSWEAHKKMEKFDGASWTVVEYTGTFTTTYRGDSYGKNFSAHSWAYEFVFITAVATQKAQAPSKLYEKVGVGNNISGKLYCFSYMTGADYNGYYTYATDSWATPSIDGASNQGPLQHLITDLSNLWVIGGGDGWGNPETDISIINPILGVREIHIMNLLGDAGGAVNNPINLTTFYYTNGATSSFVSTIRTQRFNANFPVSYDYWCSAFTMKNRFYTVSGYNSGVVNDTYYLDPLTDTWTKTTDLNNASTCKDWAAVNITP